MQNLSSLWLVFTLYLLFVSYAFSAEGHLDFKPSHRIAISADGNNQPDNHPEAQWPRADPDDWGGTPAALAMIAKKGFYENLVHYSYNNFIGAPSHTSEINQMAIGVNGAIEKWNYPNESIFIDVSETPDKAISHLAAELAKSSETDPLHFIHMGPAEFFYQAVKIVVEQGNSAALSHVYIISHSGYNDNHKRRDAHHTMDQAISLSGDRLKYEKIIDQNTINNPNEGWSSDKDYSVWYWLRDHKDSSLQWLYSRIKESGKADISDAGMVFFLLEGDQNGNPAKFRAFLGDSVLSNTNNSSDSTMVASDGYVYGPNWVSFEAEITNSDLGEWVVRKPGDAKYMTGGGSIGPIGNDYIEFTGNNESSGPPNSPLQYTFTAPKTAKYRIAGRLMQNLEGAEQDKCNDVYIKMEGDYTSGSDALDKTDLSQNQKFYGRGADSWGSIFNIEVHKDGKAQHATPYYNLKEGKSYTLTISGRSQRAAIDYFVVFESSLGLQTGLHVDFAAVNDSKYWPVEKVDNKGGSEIKDSVALLNAPSVMVQSRQITQSFWYSASENRDLNLALHDSRGNWIGAQTKNVEAGTGNTEITISLANLPKAEAGYKLSIDVREAGGDWRTIIQKEEKIVEIQEAPTSIDGTPEISKFEFYHSEVEGSVLVRLGRQHTIQELNLFTMQGKLLVSRQITSGENEIYLNVNGYSQTWGILQFVSKGDRSTLKKVRLQ